MRKVKISIDIDLDTGEYGVVYNNISNPGREMNCLEVSEQLKNVLVHHWNEVMSDSTTDEVKINYLN